MFDNINEIVNMELQRMLQDDALSEFVKDGARILILETDIRELLIKQLEIIAAPDMEDTPTNRKKRKEYVEYLSLVKVGLEQYIETAEQG